MALPLALAFFGLAQNPATDAGGEFREAVRANPRNSLAHFRLGEILLDGRNYYGAALEFRQALQGDLVPKWTEVWSHIDLGLIFELTGQEDRAVNEYKKAVATGDNTGGALAIATRHLSGKANDNLAGSPEFVRFVRPTVVKKATPAYAPEALIAELEGTVRLAVTVTPNGSVDNVDVQQGLGLGLDEAAKFSVMGWTFAAGGDENGPATMPTTVTVDFLMAAKRSRWHLLRVQFGAGDQASRPRFISTTYPLDDDTDSKGTANEIHGSENRAAFVTLAFDIDEQGIPVDIQAVKSSEPDWGSRAISFVSKWRFAPGTVSSSRVPCTVGLLWEPRGLTESSLRWAHDLFEADSPKDSGQ